jgi:hypothetical protein
MAEFVDPEAQNSANRRGITQADIEHCLANQIAAYSHRRAMVYAGTLPNGQHIKVTVENGKVTRAFFHQ